VVSGSVTNPALFFFKIIVNTLNFFALNKQIEYQMIIFHKYPSGILIQITFISLGRTEVSPGSEENSTP